MRGHTRIEVAWTIVPVLLLTIIVAFVFVKLPEIEDAPAAGPAGSLEVQVEGHQYYWLYRYPGGEIAIDDLVVPVNRVVNLEVVAPDVIHSWWIPALGGKIDAIPGRTNHTWFRAERTGTFTGRCAELCGAQHASMTASVQAVERRGVHSLPRSARAVQPDRRPGDVRGRLREVPRHGRSRHGRGSRHRRAGVRRDDGRADQERRNAHAGRGRGLVGRAHRRHHPLPQQLDRGAVDGRDPAHSTFARLEAGSRHELADDDRPQADRDPLHRHEPRLLRHRGAARTADPAPARRPGSGLHHRRQVQRALHRARHGDGLPRRGADPRRLRQLPRAADDRRARHGVPEAERALVLVLPRGRARALRELLREGRRLERRLDCLPAAVGNRVQPRQRRRPLDPVAAPALAVVTCRRDQLRGDDPQHAHARDDVHAHAAVHLGNLHVRGAADPHPADAVRRADAAALRPPARHALLRPRRGRQRAPLAARLLVLRTPRGLRDDPARVRDRVRGDPRLRAQADLRLCRDRVLHARHRVRRDARLGAPHVHGRLRAPASTASS